MLQYILYDLTLFAPGDDLVETRKDLIWCLEALVQRNQNYIKQNPKVPSLYKSGVKYMVPAQFDGECPEVQTIRGALTKSAANQADVARVLDTMQAVFGGERFRDIGRIIENGGGDCDNVAAWRCAELRQNGIPARPYMTNRTRPDGGTTYHALVLWPPIPGVPYETSEDPSLLLGMGGPSRKPDRDLEIQKNQERCDILRNKPGSIASLTPPTGDLAAAIDDVLGLRKSPAGLGAAAAEIGDLLKRMG